MRVIVPYARGCLDERTVPSITAQGYEPEVIECANIVGHPKSYPMILRDAFLSGDTFCVIEHDNGSRPGFLDAMRDCPEPWCFHAYDLSVSWEDAVHQPTVNSGPLGVSFAPLGHTKFAGHLGKEIEETVTSDFFLATWVSRDTFISGALTALGYQAHRHPGKAFHWHPYGKGHEMPKGEHLWGPLHKA